MDNKRAVWSSYLCFLIATIGSAVGLGNIWRFPYIMGKNGGAIFLLTYLFIIAFVCAIPLCLELAIGKMYKTDIISVYKAADKRFSYAGFLSLATAILIPSFYFVIGGWIINYIWIFLTNNVPEKFSEYFISLNSNPLIPSLLTFLFLLITAYFPYKGVNKGVERANNIMMPLFGAALILLVIFSLTLPGAKAGLEFMFKPDFSQFNNKMILTALGQALFTLSIGMGAMITYGSYLKDDVNIKKSAYTLIFFDTLIAILAGIMIFPIVFTNGIEPTAGATLVFISLPEIFKSLPLSNVCAVLFFFLLFFAAITSGISLLETSVDCFSSKLKISRQKAAVFVSSIVALLAIPASLSFGVLSDFKIFGKQLFDFLDFLTSNLFLPLGTLIVCILAGWFNKKIAKEAFGEGLFAHALTVILKYILPIALIIVIATGLN